MTTTKTISVQRWFHNPEIWLNIVSAVSTVASLALAQLQLLGLSPVTLFYVMIGLTLIVNAANVIVKLLTKTIVANAKTIEAIQEMPNSANVETAASNSKGTAATVELHTDGR